MSRRTGQVRGRALLASSVVAVALGGGLAACGSADEAAVASSTAGGSPASPAPPAAPSATSTTGSLGDQEAAALTYLREEEKLARDVYSVLAGTSGDRRFTNITRSEQQHFDLVGGLLVAYGVADPSAGKGPGEFADPDLQQAYDDLVERGSTSPTAAIQVGKDIEVMDLNDLAERRSSVTHDDVAAVLDRLAAGSRNHLAAFSR